MLSFPVKRALPVSSARVLFRLRAAAVTKRGKGPKAVAAFQSFCPSSFQAKRVISIMRK